MKVAICLSGQMRTFEKTYRNLMKYIVKPLNADIFIHTWSDVGASHKENITSNELVSEEKLIRMYKPKKIMIEVNKKGSNNELYGKKVPEILKEAEPIHYNSALPMFYQINKCFELLEEYIFETKVSYDVIIRVRPDSMFLEKIPKYLLKQVVKDEKKVFYADYAINTNIQVCDKFAFGGFEGMKIYSSLWKHIEKYWEEPLGTHPPQTHRVGERLLKYHVDSFDDLTAKPFYFNMYNLRHDGEKLHYKGINIKKIFRRTIDNLDLKKKKFFSNNYNTEMKCFFIHIPKVAGSSIERALFSTKGKVTHISALERKKKDKEKFDKYFKFAFVRNPYDRFISAYEYLRQGGRNEYDLNWSKKYILPYPNFKEFVLSLKNEKTKNEVCAWMHFKPQYLFVCNEDKKVMIDFVGKYENLSEDFEKVTNKLNLDIALPHENKTKERENYLNYFDDETKKIVEDIYTDDFKIFGYDKLETLKKKVILVFANYNYLTVLENWIYFINKLDINYYKIVSLDKKLYDYLVNKNIETIYSPCELDLGKLWIHRVEVIREFVEEGYDVIHSDADAVWLKNPISEFDKNLNSDLIFSQGTLWPENIYNKWGFVLCCGLFVIKSNSKTKIFLQNWLEKVKFDKDDQVSLNNLLFDEKISWTKAEDFYELNFRNKKLKCFNNIINGKTENGLKVTMLPHKEFQRIQENSEKIYIKHIISEKNSESIIEVLKNNNCYINYQGEIK